MPPSSSLILSPLPSIGFFADGTVCESKPESSRPFGPSYRAGDVVGCGVRVTTGEIFFTINGVYLGPAFHNVNNVPLRPTVGLHSSGETFALNFGQGTLVVPG